MKSNFRWHYPKNGDYPKYYEPVIVRGPDGDFLRSDPFYDDDFFKHRNYGYSYYDDDDGEGFSNCLGGTLKYTNVAAWCYLKDVYEQLNNTGWGFDPDREANDADNT